MKSKWVLLAALATTVALAASVGAEGPVARTSIEAAERGLNHDLAALWPQDPFLLLGTARGVYLSGYGTVFTAEVDLAPSPGISPFHQTVTPQDVATHRKMMLERLPKLKTEMQRMLAGVAASLDTQPMAENVVLAVTLTRHPWETRDGIPSQIVMTGERGKLVEGQRSGQLAAAVKEQEF
jgi:hypothetical protein